MIVKKGRKKRYTKSKTMSTDITTENFHKIPVGHIRHVASVRGFRRCCFRLVFTKAHSISHIQRVKSKIVLRQHASTTKQCHVPTSSSSFSIIGNKSCARAKLNGPAQKHLNRNEIPRA